MQTLDYSGDAPAASGWRAPLASAPLAARMRLPGSKSLTNRQLVLSAIAAEPTLLRSPLAARDAALMRAGIEQLGARITDIPGDGAFGHDARIEPPGQLRGGGQVDCGLAGTVMRFLPPLAALAAGQTSFDGDEAARQRPMRATLDALRQLGTEVLDDDRGTLPFSIRSSGGIEGGELRIDASASSQFVSGLLLAAPRFRRGLDLRHEGGRLPSVPHIEMTIACLRDRGVSASTLGEGRWRVEPGPVRGGTVTIEPDLSNAAPFLIATLIAGGTVEIEDWPERSAQLGEQLTELLRGFGAIVTHEDGALRCTVERGIRQGARPRGMELDLSACGELTPAVAALAALCEGTSTLTGIGHLRGHETDRLRALTNELRRAGADAHELDDGLRITGGQLHATPWRAYDDHRMATAGAIIGLAVDGVEVDDISSTSKTMPQFPALWARMLGHDAASASPAAGSAP